MKRAFLRIPLLLLALGLVVVGWRALDQHPPPNILLSDGSWLEFRAVTVGANCTYHYGPPWQRLAARLPGKLGRKYGGNAVVSAGLASPTNVIFWLVRRGAPKQTNMTTTVALHDLDKMMRTAQLIRRGAATPVVSVVPFEGLRANVRDNQGQGEPGYENPRVVSLPNGEVAIFWSVQAVPQYSPTLKLCVYRFREGGGGKQIGEMFIPNPLYQKKP